MASFHEFHGHVRSGSFQVHDGLNDQMIEWRPQWASMFREFATTWDEGVVAYDGLLLDGWTPI